MKTTQPQDSNERNGPWYTHFYMWLVVGIPVLSVVVCAALIYTAVTKSDDLVRDDWYMDGKTLKQDLSRDLLSTKLGLKATAQFGPGQSIQLQVQSDQPYAFPRQLRLDGFHPIHASLDEQATLTQISDGVYQGKWSRAPLKGKYYIELTDGKWRLRQAAEFPLTTLEMLPPPMVH